jgi:5-methylthioadenosine/S-adenosylhomocysteine deaminase
MEPDEGIIMQTADILIKNAYIITVDGERRVFKNGFLAFGAGKIVAVGTMAECDVVADQVIDGTDKLVMPGIANAHNHLVQNCFRGYNDDRWPVTDIPTAVRTLLRQLYMIVDRLDEARSYALTRLHALELTKLGYTATHDEHFTNVHARSVDGSWAALAESGMRGFLCRYIVDSEMVPEAGREKVEAGLLEIERLKAKFSSDRIEVAAGFINLLFINDPDDMVRIRQGARDLGVRFDMDMTDNTRGASLKKRGFQGGQVEYYQSLEMLTEPMYAGKAVNVLPHEFKIMADHDCRIGMVPMLRMFDGAGLPLHHLLDLGVLPGFGSDAPLVSDSQDPFEIMRQVILAQNLAVHKEMASGHPAPAARNWATSEIVIEMATLGGARTLFMDQTCGSLEVGKAADCVMLDLAQASMHPDYDRRRTVGSLAWGGNSHLVHTVFVAGRKLLENGRSTIWDEEEVIAAAEQALRDVERESELGSLMPQRAPGETARGWRYV